MEYLFLIYSDENTDPGRTGTDEQRTEILEEFRALNRDLEKSDCLLGLNPLQNTDTATTVRVRDGKITMTDGPFAETKEQLAGYYLLDCEDLDHALLYAARIPAARWGSIEIRPIMKFEPRESN